MSVVSATTTAQPGSPDDGDVYIVPSGKSGADWNAYTNWSLGYYRDGAWEQITPREGWLACIKGTDQLLRCTGAPWGLIDATRFANVSATDRILGRTSSGAGAAEEVVFTGTLTNAGETVALESYLWSCFMAPDAPRAYHTPRARPFARYWPSVGA